MEAIYLKIRQRAREIAAGLPGPTFYKDYSAANQYSRHFFETNGIITKLIAAVNSDLKNNIGHGLAHAEKVTIDAGALMWIEGRLAGYTKNYMDHRIQLVQSAGLLHDIARTEKNHAIEGAKVAKQLLSTRFDFNREEIEVIIFSIRNHEAFKEIDVHTQAEVNLVSDCLYDADKFRWGPDNFKYTVWDMIAHSKVPFKRFLSLYHQGLNSLSKIKSTFRTLTGKKYGPQFIDLGLTIGERLYEAIKAEFADAEDLDNLNQK